MSKKTKYTKPTSAQKYIIPTILAGRDVMTCCQTGLGKKHYPLKRQHQCAYPPHCSQYISKDAEERFVWKSRAFSVDYFLYSPDLNVIQGPGSSQWWNRLSACVWKVHNVTFLEEKFLKHEGKISLLVSDLGDDEQLHCQLWVLKNSWYILQNLA